MTSPGRDSLDVDALRTDRYLDALLAGAERRTDAPADVELSSEVRSAATRLARDLVRVHPSFRFEERLAGRLAELAASIGVPAAAGGEGSTIPFGGRRVGDSALGDAALLDRLGDRAGPFPLLARPLLIRGALTSAALSLAGAAFVAWRRTRSPLSPMARAVRAARQARHGLGPAVARRRVD